MKLQAVQLTENHTVHNEIEEARLLSEHLDDPKIVIGAINESSHKITKSDHFAKVASDGLFDFFSNKEAIELVHGFISIYPPSFISRYLHGLFDKTAAF
ncbi:hypothetical protein F2Q68_00032512 [Brassica cretica]|uniref:PPM-type phosphatase domain-containing protein n=2 Tax=Brassica cretica TaxID=69181 RepID=A0ABQ7BJT6_BRACR|nr:hypothetical protein F2Q68_00032512 [Brassica cretica]KAF3532917.1 hypothetical protein DY000_02042763 [Brassica cretica]